MALADDRVGGHASAAFAGCRGPAVAAPSRSTAASGSLSQGLAQAIAGRGVKQ